MSWAGSKPTVCQLCSEPLKKQFVDGKTAFGPWATMCVSCHREQGGKFGTGVAQLYNLDTLLKVKG